MTEPNPYSALSAHPEDTLFFEYLDGELPSDQSRALAAHISACPGCSARLDRNRALYFRLAQLPDGAPARDLTPLVRARLRNRSPLLALAVLVQAAAAGLVIAFSSLPLTWAAALQSMTLYVPALDVERRFQAIRGWLSAPGAVFAAWDRFNPAQILPPLTALELTALIVSATLAWLVGNGLLIASIKIKPPRRTT